MSKKTVVELLQEHIESGVEPVYDDAFWKGVEDRVRLRRLDFEDPRRDLSMSHETLHKRFTI